MSYEGNFGFEIYPYSENLERKKRIMEKAMSLLDAQNRMESNLDSTKFALFGKGMNTNGDKVEISFFTETGELGKDLYKLQIKEVEGDKVYVLDQNIMDQGVNTLFNSITKAVESPETPGEVRDALQEQLRDYFVSDPESGKVTEYSDKKAETNISAEEAEWLLDGLQMEAVQQRL